MATTPYETQAIRNLQRYLRRLSRFDGDIPPVEEDGIFGEETRTALSAFQEKYGLPVSGTATPETWAALFEAYLADVERATRPDPVYIFPRYPADYAVGRGDEGTVVAVIQFLLRDIILLYGQDADLLPIDGIFGPTTEKAIKDFQRVHRLPDDGRVDRITWNRLTATAEGMQSE